MHSLSDLSPSRYLTFTYPHPHPHPLPSRPYSDPLRIAVLDSPLRLAPPPVTAAMFVPPGREHDWIFSTLAGHLSLIISSSVSRLVLIGSVPEQLPKPYMKVSPPDLNALESSIMPLLLALCPQIAFRKSTLPRVPFLSFEDSAIRIVPKEIIVGSIVGDMIVEDVAIENSNSDSNDSIEIRRRLRFKRMPNLIQTQVLLSPNLPSCSTSDSNSDWLSVLDSESIRVKNGSLVQPYLAPMVAGLSLISHSLMEKLTIKTKPRCLCLGVGGGDLLMCLNSKLGFDVIGVEIDPVVLDVAKKHFDLVEDEFLHVHIGNGIQIINEFALKFRSERKIGLCFDAIMVDLDSGDVVSGVKAPPLELLEKDFLLNIRSILCENGVLVINVIPPLDDESFLKGIFEVFIGVFTELYRVDVEGDESFVLFATIGKVGIERKWEFVEKLEEIVGEKLIRSIRKIGDDKDQK
ncbi:hypothetical protein LUZ60_008253 [Juncus effusus]|nr:hypothetical protein LUZ60_008253 [Juncus effusus]